jgi:ubiquinone/menaquinone biosynthesis C-methylase UbiE
MVVFTSGTGRVLDIGCGKRHYAGYCGAETYVGVDIGLLPDVAASATALPFRGGSFDRVVMLDVLEHVADVNLALRECRRVLTRDGLLLILTPNTVGFGIYDSFADQTHLHHFTWWGLSKILWEHHFKIVEKIPLHLHIYLPLKRRILRYLQQSICVVAVKNDSS